MARKAGIMFLSLRHGIALSIGLVALLVALVAVPQPAQAQYEARAALPGDWQVVNVGQGNRMPLFEAPGTLFKRTGYVQDGDRILHMGCRKEGLVSWCEVQKLAGDRARGFLPEHFVGKVKAPPPVAEPDYLVVYGLKPGERLNVRREPNGNAQVLATLGLGERVRNLGCRAVGSQRWCRIRSLEGVDVTGWVNGNYVRDAGSPPWPGDDTAGGPDMWQVAGLRSNEVLPLRETASPTGRILLSLINGDLLRNLGCKTVGSTRWCRVTYTDGVNITGWVDGRYLREATPAKPPPPPAEPDYWTVSGLRPGDTLNVRDAPSTSGRIISTVVQGERLRNLGCTDTGRGRWCQIRTTVGRVVTGYVSARYLTPSR